MQQHLAKEIVIFGVFVADTGHPISQMVRWPMSLQAKAGADQASAKSQAASRRSFTIPYHQRPG